MTSPSLSRRSWLQRVCRIAWITCACLATVSLGMAVKTLIEHGGTLPAWTSNPAPTEELQAGLLGWERFSYTSGVIEQLIYYGLFSSLFRSFEKRQYFTKRSVRVIEYLAMVFFLSVLLHAVGPLFFGLPTNVVTAFLRDIGGLLIAGVTLIAAWVLQEGCRIQEEQALTI